MNLIKLLGIAVVAGAGVGVWASGAIREKFGIGGNTKNAPKGKVEVIRIDPKDELVGAKVFVREKTED